MGLVEVAVANNGDVYYRMRPDVTEEEVLGALAAVMTGRRAGRCVGAWSAEPRWTVGARMRAIASSVSS